MQSWVSLFHPLEGACLPSRPWGDATLSAGGPQEMGSPATPAWHSPLFS